MKKIVFWFWILFTFPLFSQTYKCIDVNGIECDFIMSSDSYLFKCGENFIQINIDSTVETSTYTKYVPENSLDTLIVFKNGWIYLVNGFKQDQFYILKEEK